MAKKINQVGKCLEFNEAYVYIHIRNDTNEVFYVGIGSSKNYERAYNFRNRTDYWKRVYKKCGRSVVILHKNLTWKEAIEIEIALIAFHGRRDLGHGTLCNLTDGGEGVLGRKIPRDIVEKIRLKNIGKKLSEETKRKIGLIHIGNKYRLGSIASEETRKKLSEAKKGYKPSQETLEKLKICQKGKYVSPETGEKISKSKKGKNLGVKTDNHSKRILHIPSNKVFKSIAEASREFNYRRCTLGKLLENNNIEEFKFISNEEYFNIIGGQYYKEKYKKFRKN